MTTPILERNLEEKPIAIYPSIASTVDYGFDRRHVHHVLTGEHKTHKGSTFEYIKGRSKTQIVKAGIEKRLTMKAAKKLGITV